jgi:purine nucleosidase
MRAMASAAPIPVIIDTDPGLDDAIAILLALRSPEFHLLGVTTVAGNLGLPVTTRNALRVLALGGRSEIPVAPGADVPLRRGPIVSDVHGIDGLGGVDLPEPQREQADFSALNFLSEALLSRPDGAVVILALGPLTNIACLIEERPEIAQRLGRIIAMGGAVAEPGNVGPKAEFNLAADPEAAAVVFGSGIPVTLVPLDVTRKVRVDRAWTARLAAAGDPFGEAAARLVGAYFDETAGAQSRPLHDPCVMLHVVDPGLFGTKRLKVRVATDMSDPGALSVAEDGDEVDVLLTVDAAGAVALLTERIGHPDASAAR